MLLDSCRHLPSAHNEQLIDASSEPAKKTASANSIPHQLGALGGLSTSFYSYHTIYKQFYETTFNLMEKVAYDM